MTRTRLTVLFAFAALVAFMLVPGVAQANFAIHGGYVADTDACAGCHRAHTSVSPMMWTASSDGSQHSALLVSDATLMYQFCYACHDAAGDGADTNVQDGVYEGDLYGTENGDLNGGGFDTYKGVTVSSTHLYSGETSWGAYGGGVRGASADPRSDPASGATGLLDPANPILVTGTGEEIPMDCASCHDPHGSSNYRLLKDEVYGNRVGGYTGNFANSVDPTPTPFVTSVETGYPTGGFRLHIDYSKVGPRVTTPYVPDYTTALYAKGQVDADMPDVAAAKKGMTGWCVGCHSTYLSKESTYAAESWGGFTERHRHPVNVPLTNFKGVRSVITTSVLPLANDPGERAQGTGDWIDCLTCHRAHGTSAQMEGYAAFLYDIQPAYAGSEISALLRLDNRGVCEGCHNK